MMLEVDATDVVERRADGRGRITIGSEFAGKTVEVAVLGAVDGGEDRDHREFLQELREETDDDEAVAAIDRRLEELEEGSP